MLIKNKKNQPGLCESSGNDCSKNPERKKKTPEVWRVELGGGLTVQAPRTINVAVSPEPGHKTRSAGLR